MSKWFTQEEASNAKLKERLNDIHANVAFRLRDSVKFGTEPLTAAPGQPVDTGNLRDSWILSHPEKLLSTLLATGKTPDGEEVGYARYIEEGVGMTFGAHGGGPHSVKMTVSAFKKLVKAAVSEEVS